MVEYLYHFREHVLMLFKGTHRQLRSLQTQLLVRRNSIFLKFFLSQVESEIQVESSLYFGSVIQVESSIFVVLPKFRI